MNTNDNHNTEQLMACLVQHEISDKMIAIVESKRERRERERDTDDLFASST